PVLPAALVLLFLLAPLPRFALVDDVETGAGRVRGDTEGPVPDGNGLDHLIVLDDRDAVPGEVADVDATPVRTDRDAARRRTDRALRPLCAARGDGHSFLRGDVLAAPGPVDRHAQRLRADLDAALHFVGGGVDDVDPVVGLIGDEDQRLRPRERWEQQRPEG